MAKGGFHGLGNARFKSSVNRAPRETSEGTLGDSRNLRMELKLLADVGLLGLPNAGKSTFVSVVSNATPKIADYPFTTLIPGLGVVRVGDYKSFVVADIPGLIEGASEGVGLGVKFLKHLSRTGILLHIVDVTGEGESEPVAAIKAILGELENFSDELIGKERWLVFNKVDMLPKDEVDARCDEICRAIGWKGPVYKISALAKQGTELLCKRLMTRLEQDEACDVV